MNANEVAAIAALAWAAESLASDARSILRKRHLRCCDAARLAEARKLLKLAHRDMLFCFTDLPRRSEAEVLSGNGGGEV